MGRSNDLGYSPSRDQRPTPLSRYKPEGANDGPGPSLWVNPSFVAGYFGGVKPHRAGLTLIVRPQRQVADHPAVARDDPAATRIELRYRPPRERKAAPVAYYKPDDMDDERGPSLFVNQTFVRSHFQGVEPERAKLTLVVREARPLPT